MTDSLFEAVAHATRELTKYGFSTQEFAMLVQQHNMTDTEALAVAKVFDYIPGKAGAFHSGFPAPHQPPPTEGSQDL